MTAAATPATLDLAFRPATPGDDPAVNSAFMRSLWGSEGKHVVGPRGSSTWNTLIRRAWEGCRGELATVIAHPPTKPTVIAGFVVAGVVNDRPSVAWVCTQGDWRKLGVARRLLAEVGVTPGAMFFAWFPTDAGLRLFRSKGYRPIVRPFGLWRWL